MSRLGRRSRSFIAVIFSSALIVTALPPAFGACSEFQVVTRPSGWGYNRFAVGDFNGDGNADLVTFNDLPHIVEIFLGQDDGSLSLVPGHHTAAALVEDLAVGDLNGDGKLDLVAANMGQSAVSVLLGNGDGTLLPRADYPVQLRAYNVAVADFDVDGNLDVAVYSQGIYDPETRMVTPVVVILPGHGDGTLGSAVDQHLNLAGSLITGDFNRDAKPDLAVRGTAGISVLLGRGDGTLASPVLYATSAGPVLTNDFDGDGILDFVVVASGAISFLRGNGDGTFAPALVSAIAGNFTSAITRDFTGDGKPDLAVSTTQTVSILAGIGDGTFTETFSRPQSTGTIVGTGDFNDGGRADVVFASGQNILTFLWDGECEGSCGTFDPSTQFAAGNGPISTVVADITGDGKNDLVVANNGSDTVSVLPGTGNGAFGAAQNYVVGSHPFCVSRSDLNRDGKPDLVVANNASGSVSILLNNGGGGFGAAVHYATGTGPVSVTTGDFDRDGVPDVAVANFTSSNVSILRGSSNGTLATAVHYGAGENPIGIVSDDFDHDAIPDLAVANSGSANVSILMGIGDGTFAPAANYAAGGSPSSVTAGDFNGDGKRDLVVANANTNDLSILLGKGDGTFNAAASYPVGAEPHSIAAADVNHDGRADIVTANYTSDDVSILMGHGDGTFEAAISRGTGTHPYSVAVGELSEDGKRDLAVTNYGSATVSVLLNTCPVPDVAIAKTHEGNFTQGQTGATYRLAVSNVSDVVATGTFSVTDTPPPSLTITAMNGDGWTCTVATRSCVRTGVLDPRAVFPPITVSVNVAADAPATVTNTATLSAPGDGNSANNTTSDAATVIQFADLSITKTHSGYFTLGQTGAAYTLTVRNRGSASTAGGVSVSDQIPQGLAATAIAGAGWTCDLGSLTCTRDDALASETSYPPITVTVTVAADAPSSVTNTATVSGGGDVTPANNTAFDPTLIPRPDLIVIKTHNGDFALGQIGATYTITVQNAGSLATSGIVTVTDLLPAGLTATAIAGTGWSCNAPTLVCTRSDSSAAGAAYPVITLTVDVAADAPASVTNTAVVSGGGEVLTSNNSATNPTTIYASPDLTIATTLSENLHQGQIGATFTLSVTNIGRVATSGLVTVAHFPLNQNQQPMEVTTVTGTGWYCSVPLWTTCTRTDALAPGASYPPVTVTARLKNNAPSAFTTVARVLGGGNVDSPNDYAYDPITVAPRSRGDFDLDGMSDVIWRKSTTGENAMWVMNGMTIRSPESLPQIADADWKIAGVGDFDGDGKADVLWIHDLTGDVVVWLMNGSSLTSAANVTTLATTNWRVAGIGDFDADGKSDVLWHQALSGQNVIWKMSGTSINSTGWLPAMNLSWTVAGVADFNDDGKADVFWHNETSGENLVWIMAGTSILKSRSTLTVADTNYKLVGIGDVSGDAKADVVWWNQATGEVIVWRFISTLNAYGNGTFDAFGQSVAVVTDVNWRVVVTADFDGDDRSDLLWRHSSTGEVAIWLMDGFSIKGTALLPSIPDLNWLPVGPR